MNEIRHQLMPGTTKLIQSSTILEIEGAQYLVKIVASKRAIEIKTINADELDGMFPPRNVRFLTTFEL